MIGFRPVCLAPRFAIVPDNGKHPLYRLTIFTNFLRRDCLYEREMDRNSDRHIAPAIGTDGGDARLDAFMENGRRARSEGLHFARLESDRRQSRTGTMVAGSSALLRDNRSRLARLRENAN